MEAYLVRGDGSRAQETGARDNAPPANEERGSNVSPSDDEPTSTGPRSRGSSVMEYFEYIPNRERAYLCTICNEKYPNNPKNILLRQKDGSTNSFWRHLKAKHREKHDALKGIDVGQTRLTDTSPGGAGGSSSAPRRRPLTGRTEEETKNHITRYICCTDTPFRNVDHVTFKEMWRYNAQAEIEPPSSKTIRAWSIAMFSKMKEGVKELFLNVRRISLTADVWTSDNGIGLLGVTVHWVDANWQYRERVLGLRDLAGKHDGENMAEELLKVTDEFGITHKLHAITTDNASSNYKMLSVIARTIRGVNPRFTKRRHIPCAAHVLNLVVQAAMKSLEIPVAGPVDIPDVEPTMDVDTDDDLYFSEEEEVDTRDVLTPERVTLGTAVSKLRILVRAIGYSEKRTRQYLSLCEERIKRKEMTDKNKLILDCPTRWNSTFDMIKVALTKRDVIDVMSLSCPTNGKITKMLKEEWDLLARFSLVLGRFSATSNHLAQSRIQTISDVLYLFQGLQDHLQQTINSVQDARVVVGSKRARPHEDCTLIDTACMDMKTKLEKYLHALYSNKAIIAATILDPYHKGDMLDQRTREKGISFIRDLLPVVASEAGSSARQAQEVLFCFNYFTYFFFKIILFDYFLNVYTIFLHRLAARVKLITMPGFGQPRRRRGYQQAYELRCKILWTT